MIAIQNIDGNIFEIDGIRYYKNFISLVFGNKLKIVGVYDSTLQLTELLHYDQFTVNGNGFGSAAALQSALLPVLYTRSTLNGINIESDIIDIAFTGSVLSFTLADDTVLNIDLPFVQTVTGTGVSNADPRNPVLSLASLFGDKTDKGGYSGTSKDIVDMITSIIASGQAFTATSEQTVFTLSNEPNFVMVFDESSFIASSEYTLVDNVVTFTIGRFLGNKITIVKF